jgi:alpha-L-fucosidase 2
MMNVRKRILFVFGLILLSDIPARSEELPASDLQLWFTRPAAEWNEALPVGNGRLGAMVFGGVESERLQLNEETVWTKEDMNFANPAARSALPEVRQLLFDGKYAEAQELAQKNIMGRRERNSTYQTLGDLELSFGPYRGLSDYRRELDLETAIAKVSYQANRTQYTREIFSSTPDQALIVRLTVDCPKALSFTVRLSRPGDKATIEATGDGLRMSEHVNDGRGVRMAAILKVMQDGGVIVAAGDSVRVDSATTATLLLTAATDYRGHEPADMAALQMSAASAKSIEVLKEAHVEDYQTFFKRVDFDLGPSDGMYFPTDARVAAMKNGYVDPGLIVLYYQFGRYLLISSSRPGCLPANLQGIWADGLWPPWSADYHININIQMNYWLSETTNLAELHEPFLKFIDALRPGARKTAKDVYGCRGTVAHYTTDVWHFTVPEGRTQYGMWPMGMAWSCQHLWEHYAFNGDKDYLKDFAYPIMKEAAEFCIDWLVPNPKTGYLVSGPSISPENRFRTPDGKIATMVMGPTMDHMIIRDLLQNTIEASKILGTDKSFRSEMMKTLDKLAATRVGSDGRLMEWTEEFEEPEPGHRHISHLFGLHPSDQITGQRNPELMDAARKTIDYRLEHGGGHTGWSRAWIINFFARLHEGKRAYENVLALLRKSTLPNLFDTHPPFQIDGNFGGTAGITEMLLQSHAGEIELLPALPAAWQEGHIHGLCARGGFVVDIDWEKGKLKQARIVSKLGNPCKVRFGEKRVMLNIDKGTAITLDGELNQP